MEDNELVNASDIDFDLLDEMIGDEGVDPDEVKCSSEDPTKYYEDAAENIRLQSNNRPLSSVIRSSEYTGLKGTVVPRATRLGGSKGFNPHKPGIVNIVDTLAGTTVQVDLSRLGDGVTSKVYDHDEPNLSKATADAFRKLAMIAPPVDEKTFVKTGNRQAKSNKTNTKRSGGQSLRSAFNNKEPMFQQEVPSKIRPQAVIREQVSEPTIRVMFEFEGFGNLEAAYHHAVVEDKFLVLGYDTRYKSSFRFSPQKCESLVFVDITTMPNVYQVHSAGIRFTLDQLDITVLLIEDSAPKDGGKKDGDDQGWESDGESE